MIELEGVGHRFPDATADVLCDLDVRLDERRVGVIGANGSGKSTFLRLINGLIVPERGRVRVDGLDTAREAAAVRRRVGFCFTDPDSQIIMPTVAEDVAYGLRRRPRGERPDAATIRREVDTALARFGLSELADRPAHVLSGGQKQLLALASVLITRPSLLVMDEPTTLLDRRHARLIAEVIGSLEPRVVLATHHLHLLAGFDRVLVFDGGRLVADDAPAAAVAYYERLA